MRKNLGVALGGLVLGALAVPLAMATLAPVGFLVFAALVAVAALRPEGRALGGGLLISFALWWVYFVRGAVDRCDLMNRQPGGSCAIYGTNEQLALAGCVAIVGALLVASAVRLEKARP